MVASSGFAEFGTESSKVAVSGDPGCRGYIGQSRYSWIGVEPRERDKRCVVHLKRSVYRCQMEKINFSDQTPLADLENTM